MTLGVMKHRIAEASPRLKAKSSLCSICRLY